MPSAEFAPEPTYAAPETHSETLPHFSIPGFEKLPPDAQARYLKIPPIMLERARPLIEAKIAEYAEGSEDVSEGEQQNDNNEDLFHFRCSFSSAVRKWYCKVE